VSGNPYIPPRTRGEISNPAQPGHRHHQALKIALSLIGQGLSPNAVFAHLREMHAQAIDFSDHEIVSIIDWAVAQNPSPCGGVNLGHRALIRAEPVRERVTSEEAIRNAKDFLGGWHCTIADLWHASPWPPDSDWRKDSSRLIAALYEPGDYINLVKDFSIERLSDGKEKANPRGAGKTLLRDEWLSYFRIHGTPQTDAGCWIRPNPVRSSRGSGAQGAHTDQDVADFRLLLLESDQLPLGLQISLWSRLPLPVAVLLDTGGRSIHAWLKIDCKDEAEYREIASLIYQGLARFGLCPNNKNPSRLSRLPGAMRLLGARMGKMGQRLLYLNGDQSERPIFEEEKNDD
jgi:hypothetical protein